MNFPLKIARRYLFAKKSTNAINLLTGIAIFGISIGTAALILVLSVFNGFEDLITGMYSNFNPDVQVSPVKGKFFNADSSLLQQLSEVEGVAFISETIEEVAFFEYKDKQNFGILKGVDKKYKEICGIDSLVREGQYKLHWEKNYTAVLGLGMRNKLGVNVDDPFSALSIYMPKRKKVGLFEQQFRKRSVLPAGTFVAHQEFDGEYVLVDLDFVRQLMGVEEQLSALEIKLYPGFDDAGTVEAIQAICGSELIAKNRYQQQESFLKLMKIEKWLSYAIASLMMLMIAFNIIGALWMIVLEKQKDIAILKSMGATNITVRNIFLNQGLLICVIGLLTGIFFSLLLFFLQKQTGFISLPGDLIVDAYPISLRLSDFVVVGVTVFFIGLLASIPPALRAMRVPALIREE